MWSALMQWPVLDCIWAQAKKITQPGQDGGIDCLQVEEDLHCKTETGEPGDACGAQGWLCLAAEDI